MSACAADAENRGRIVAADGRHALRVRPIPQVRSDISAEAAAAVRAEAEAKAHTQLEARCQGVAAPQVSSLPARFLLTAWLPMRAGPKQPHAKRPIKRAPLRAAVCDG